MGLCLEYVADLSLDIDDAIIGVGTDAINKGLLRKQEAVYIGDGRDVYNSGVRAS